MDNRPRTINLIPNLCTNLNVLHLLFLSAAGLDAILANLSLRDKVLRVDSHDATVEIYHCLIANDTDNLSTIELLTIALVNVIANLMHSTFLSCGRHSRPCKNILPRTVLRVKNFFCLPSHAIRTKNLTLTDVFLDIALIAHGVIPPSKFKRIKFLVTRLANLLFHRVLLFLHHVEHFSMGCRQSQAKKKPHP